MIATGNYIYKYIHTVAIYIYIWPYLLRPPMFHTKNISSFADHAHNGSNQELTSLKMDCSSPCLWNQCRKGTNCSTSCCLSLRSSFTWSSQDGRPDFVKNSARDSERLHLNCKWERSANNFRFSIEFLVYMVFHTWFSLSQHPEIMNFKPGKQFQPSAEQTWQCFCRPSFIYQKKLKLWIETQHLQEENDGIMFFFIKWIRGWGSILLDRSD